MIDLADRVYKLRMIRAKMKEIKERHKAELADFVTFEARLKGELFDFLRSTNQLNARTINGTPYIIQKITYPLEDPAQFRSHIIGAEAWDLVDWRANKTAMDAFRLSHGGIMDRGMLIGGDLPPGVSKNELQDLGVKPPTKPKTTVAKGDAAPTEAAEDNDVETL
jgi:hypothetical protein